MITANSYKKIFLKQMYLGNLIYEASMSTKKFNEMVRANIYLMNNVGGVKFLENIKDFIKQNKLNTKIVIDHDDDIFNTSPLSSHYEENGTEEIKIMNNGKVMHEWKDGVNINIKENRFKMDETKRTCGKADLITVTTENLAKVFRQYSDNVKVLPNCIDLTQWNRLDIKRKNPDEIRIGWAGGSSHWDDLHMIRESMLEIAKKYKNVKIVMIGWKPVSMEKEFEGQIEFYPWVETPAHPYRLAALDLDIAMIPLRDNQFNRGKSPIKWIEFSSLKVPCVTSYVSPYKEVADLDPEAGIYIEENDLKGWVKGIDLLINSPRLRQDIGEKARSLVEKHFDINTQYHQWIEAYEGVLNDNRVKSLIV
jgi:glycosyltransferase involved in cell wall biosynthesis